MDDPSNTFTPTDLSEPRHFNRIPAIVETIGSSGIRVKALTVHSRRQGVLVTVEGVRRDGQPWTIAQMQSLMRALGPAWVDIETPAVREVGDWHRWAMIGHVGDVVIELVGDREDSFVGGGVMDDIDLSALFDAPRIHTDDDGRHWDEQGREYRLVKVDGEATFVPLDEVA